MNVHLEYILALIIDKKFEGELFISDKELESMDYAGHAIAIHRSETKPGYVMTILEESEIEYGEEYEDE